MKINRSAMLEFRGRMLGIAWLALFALSLQGCTVRNLPVLDLHRSELVTPAGSVPLEVGTLRHLSTYRVNYEQQLVARHRGLMVTIGVFPQGQLLTIQDSAGEHEILAVDGESFYQLNSGERLQISTRSVDDVVPASRRYRRFEFELPPPLSTFNIASRRSLMPAIVERIEAGEDDIHALYIPFLVDGEKFAIDMEFSVTVETHRYFAAPATP